MYLLLNIVFGGNMNIICIDNISKSYYKDNKKISVLNKLFAKFENNKFYVIMGESGVGKSTLLNCLSLLCPIDEGTIKINDKNISSLKDETMSEIRLNNIGIVFQAYHLFSYLNACENVMLPLLLKNEISIEKKKELAEEMLKYVGLDHRISHYPSELSGGEQQRVAIARSLINEPSIILADEPTGNLDNKNKNIVLNLLKKISLGGKCVIVVSHDVDVISYADEIYELKNGKLIKNENKV